jgi:tetratricopeptide (TPR) repeat protein
MSKGKSVRILAAAALLGVAGYWFISKHAPAPAPTNPSGGTSGSAGSAGGAAQGTPARPEAGLDLTLARETGAAWYCEGDAVKGAWEKAHAELERVATSPDATPQDLVNLACVKLKLNAEDMQKQAEETPAIQELCKRALERDPKLASAHFVLGVLAADRESDFAAARSSFEKAAECAPDEVSAKLRWADALNEVGERDKAIDVYRSVRQRGREFAGSFYLTATFRLARLLRQRKGEADLKESAALLAEHKALTDAGSPNPSEEEIKLGTLAKVKVPPSRGATAGAPASPPPVHFDPLPPLLADELAQVLSFDVADLDADQRDDLVASGLDKDGKPGVWALLQDANGAFAKKSIAAGAFTRVLAVDLENEFGLDLILIGSDGSAHLFCPDVDEKNTTWNGWLDRSAQLPPLAGEVKDVVGVDFGHEGNLDLAFATSEGLKLLRNDGIPHDPDTRNRVREGGENGPLKGILLKDVSAESGMPTGPIAWVAIEDFDGDQDIDLICGGPGAPTTICSNLRKGKFDLQGPEKSGLPRELSKRPLLADFDHDGRPDLLAPGNPPLLCRNKGGGVFENKIARSDLATLWSGGAALADVDLDGELDFVGTGIDGTITARFGALAADPAATLALGGSPAPNAAPKFVDLDDDGDLDLVTVGAKGGLVVRCGSVASSAGSLLLQLHGVKDNRQAIGTVVEVRAQAHYDRRLTTEHKPLFGLGDHKNADVVRITWPNGVVQCFVGPDSRPATDEKRQCGAQPHVASARPATIVNVMQKEGLISSCPFLYAWRGDDYGFVSDVIGITPLGLPISDDEYVPPDHDELVRVTGEQLKPVDGEYRFQFTEELREVTFLDRAQLWVIDHAADVEVHPEERFTFPPFPPMHVHTVKGALPIVKAVDQAGRDWTHELVAVDGKHAVPFEPLDSRFLGLVTAHTLELTLPDAVKDAKKVRLLMTGWFYWADASVNLLAARSQSIQFVPPVFSVPDGEGGWRECGPPVGFPAGKTKTMVLDVTSMLNRNDPRLKIFSTIRLYWDAIRVAVDDDDAPITITKLEPARANLWYRGFSAPLNDDRGETPALFDWSRLETQPRWNQHPGMLTRYGDVVPLLGDVDDRFVILSSGDAIDLRFDAKTTPPKSGMARTYLLFLDGWAKDADPNTTFSQSVTPLPFHGMSGYPYRADEHYPDDPAHLDYQLEWNTRPARRLIPSLAPEGARASPR